MQWLVRFRVFIIISVAVVLIAAAVIFSALRAVLPYATGYKHEIQQEISKQIGLPIEIGSIDATIHWFSPALRLINFSIYDERNKVPLFNFEEAFVEVDVIASLLHGELIVADVGLVGTDISIERLTENTWSVQGIKFTSSGDSRLPDSFTYMMLNSNYLLHNCNIYYKDHTDSRYDMSLEDVNIDVKNEFAQHDIRLSMRLLESYGDTIMLVASLQGDLDDLSGELYLDARSVNLKQFNNKFEFLKDYDIRSRADVQLWVDIDDPDEYAVTANVSADDLSIRNLSTKRKWSTPSLSTRFKLERDESNWSIQVSGLEFGEVDNRSWPVPVELTAGVNDENYYLNSNFLRVGDVLDIAHTVISKQQWNKLKPFEQLEPKADIYNLEFRLDRKFDEASIDQSINFQASIYNLSVDDPSTKYSVSGLDFDIDYRPGNISASLASNNTRIAFGSLFRKPLFAKTIAGEIIASKKDDHWVIGSEQLQVMNDHADTYSRMHLDYYSADNIQVDLQSNFYNANAKYTSDYLPVGIMKSSLVDWLDTAVVGGHASKGNLLLHGLLSDFPYRKDNGIFQVVFDTNDATIKFLDSWPVIEHAQARIKFENESLHVDNVTAKTDNIDIVNGQVDIDDLKDAVIRISTRARSANIDLQSYVWHSRLDPVLGDAFRLFQLKGNSTLALKIDVPLNTEKLDVSVKGQLNLENTELYYTSLGYELTAINGVVEFTDKTVFADGLSAMLDGRKVKLNVDNRKNKKGSETVFTISGPVDVDYLLHDYGWLPDDWVSGVTDLNIQITIPDYKASYLADVSATGSLKGIDINVSDGLNVHDASRYSLQSDIKVLEDGNLQIEAEVTDRKNSDTVIDLFATRDKRLNWVFDIDSALLAGRGEFNSKFTKDTQITLNLELIDLYTLFYRKSDGESGTLQPSTIPPINFKSAVVQWNGWTFTDVVLQTSWHENGMLIDELSLNGPDMKFSAAGTWLTTWRGTQETMLQGKVTSKNFGNTLAALGFQRSVDRCKYSGSFETRWPAAPYSISWSNMKGKTHFEMTKGVIPEVDPGAGGRLLGLLNLFKLANRLKLDFKDVTEHGFGFDKISGNFEFAQGEGSLKDFVVSAPAADITMFGKIGLVDHDYGLLMHVKPHTSTITFAGGTLLGGVVVGAGLALLQNVLDIGIVGQDVYTITGSWDEPVIEKVVERNKNLQEDDDY